MSIDYETLVPEELYYFVTGRKGILISQPAITEKSSFVNVKEIIQIMIDDVIMILDDGIIHERTID